MILIGMFDSPFVRRVAVSATRLGMPFEHRSWSVGKDAEAIRAFSPQARVPVLVLDSGETLIESFAILDHLDDLAGPERALLPRGGAERRRALKLVALAMAAVDKGILPVYERIFRPAEKRHAPWVARCEAQAHAAFAELDTVCAALAPDQWLIGPQPMQPDYTLACASTYLSEAAGLDLGRHPALAAHVRRTEALPEMRACYLPFDAPKTD